jgi:hypothetical protein
MSVLPPRSNRLSGLLTACALLTTLSPAPARPEVAPRAAPAQAWAARLERLCSAPSREFAAKAEPIARWATLEHRLFKGHEVGLDGRIWRFGNTEAESEPLDDATRREIDTRDARSWERVVTYWENGLGAGRSPALSAQVALDAINLPRLALDPAIGRSSAEWLARIPQLVQQASISNRPWSAAFVSHVMRQAELGPAFAYSELHSTFIADALSQTFADLADPGPDPGARPGPAPRAFRGCPPETTSLRPGDLLCFTRDAAVGPRNFAQLAEVHRVAEAGARGSASTPPGRAAFPAHCDVVTRADAAARRVEVVGGNAWQSVTRRTMGLDARGRLAPTLRIPAEETAEREDRCRATAECGNLNRKRYLIVMRLR